MTELNFRWLHLSDLHFGMGGQGPLWSTLKHHFYDDLPLLFQQSGPWDLVVFSGDIVQRGSREEYNAVTEVLLELYQKMHEFGCRPKFLAVPGNHDLVRPAETDMPTILLQDWHIKGDQVRKPFLEDPKSPFRETILTAFANYQSWYDELPSRGIPAVEVTPGMLPGDQAIRIPVDGGQVGIVGLNSTWLQLSNATKPGDLHVDLRQLSAVLPDAEGWCRANDFNLVVTHQPVEWLGDNSQQTWKAEIAPPGRFDLHMFGHMHSPVSSSLSIMGSTPVNSFQSPSLFGMEYLADDKTERIHGYSAGAFSNQEGRRCLTIWPRSYNRSRSGQAKMTPNNDFHLADNISTKTSLPDRVTTKRTLTSEVTPAQASGEQALPRFVATAPVERDTLLVRFRHHLLHPGPHAMVRKEEQDAAKRGLAVRCLWIVADWGLSSDEFVSSVLHGLSLSTVPTYRMDLSEIPFNGEDLDQEIESKLGLRIQELSEELALAGEAVLLLDDIALGEHPAGILPRELELENLAQAMLDYCPALRIIIRTRSDPKNGAFQKVQIGALDEADLKAYMLSHPSGGQELSGADVVDQLLAVTGGIPDRLDKALKDLKVVSLSELVASHREDGDQTETNDSQGLTRAIDELEEATPRALQRAMQLLQALAAFPHGVQFEQVKRFHGVHGFHPPDASELRQRALITTSTMPGLEQHSQAEAKRILSVPRMVREAVRSRMSEDDLNSYDRRAAEIYFGFNWRAGSTSWPPDRKYSSPKCSHHEIANASAILLRLLKSAIQNENEEELSALMHLAAAYSGALIEGSHYYGTASFCASFLHTAPPDIDDEMVARVRLHYAEALRITGERPKAVDILESLDPSLLDKSDRESRLLDLALAYDADGNEKAVEVASQLLKSTKSASTKMQARSIILQAEKPSSARRSKMVALEQEARKKKLVVVANNLALKLAEDSGNAEEALRYLDNVISPLKASDNIYNITRATVALAERKFEAGGTLSNADHSRLMQAYQYLFIQRIPRLFDRCHSALWKSFQSRGEVPNLFALFRHSSFIWRVRGVTPKEDRYISALNRIATEDVPDNRDAGYFRARLEIAAQQGQTSLPA